MGSCSCSEFPSAQALCTGWVHWAEYQPLACATAALALLCFLEGDRTVPSAQRAREEQDGLWRAWLRVALPLCPGLELLLGLSLLRWASGWEQGHAIRLSAELFIPGRRATAGKGTGPDAGPFTRVLLKAAEPAVLLELRWGRNPPRAAVSTGVRVWSRWGHR